MDSVRKIVARDWRTPLTGKQYQWGNARLRQSTSGKGYYRMEGIEGFELYEIIGPGRMPVTQLQRRDGARWKTWMVDDPLHWYGMRERVMSLPAGRLLVAGLGLGLFAHHLMERPDITEVVVVEIDEDVANLIKPSLPDHLSLSVVVGDFYDFLKTGTGIWKPDAVLWDLAVGQVNETRADFYRSLAEVNAALPGVHLSQFGLRGNAQTIIG